MSLFGGKSNSQFDSLLNKATSNLNLETDWAAILNLCDLIRQQDVGAKYAVTAVRKKLCHENPHTVFYALQTIEAMVKNCGTPVYDEVLTMEFLDLLKELSKSQDPVKEKMLELIQIWASVFSNQSRYRCIQDVFSSLKREGFSFPAVRSSDAMFEAEAAPEWKEGSLCYKCRAQFGTFRRKHHCRSCGNIFCDECSDKRSIIPRFGIEKEVRVCKACFDDINKSSSADSNRLDERSESEAKTNKDKERELELREKEELELALALSASEAENKRNKPRQQQAAGFASGASTGGSPSAGPAGSTGGLYSKLDTSGMDPELVVYLDRNYWEKRRRDGQGQQQQQQQPESQASAGVSKPAAATSATVAGPPEQAAVQRGGQANGESGGLGKDEDAEPREEFLRALASSIEVFVNRMKADSVRGRSVAADGTVQTLFMTLNQMHPQLIEHMNRVEARRNILEVQQDKLARLRDAREALNALREEHDQRRKAEQQEREKQRFAQMMHKLEEMRQKKHEYVEYQRQLQIQQMEAQRREFEMRMEAQKQRQAMEQYKQQFPYSSGAYQQQFGPQVGQQPPPPASSGGYAIQYPPGYGGQPHQQQAVATSGYMVHSAPSDPNGHYMYNMQQQQQMPTSDAQYSTAPMSMPSQQPQHHPQQQYPHQQQQQQQPSYAPYGQPGDAYSMQAMAHSLPPQQQQQHHPGPQTTSSDPQQPPPQQQQPQQQQQQQSQSDEAQLIQF